MLATPPTTLLRYKAPRWARRKCHRWVVSSSTGTARPGRVSGGRARCTTASLSPWPSSAAQTVSPLFTLCSQPILSLTAAATDVGFLCHCRGDTQVRAEGDGRAGAHAVPPQEPPPGTATTSELFIRVAATVSRSSAELCLLIMRSTLLLLQKYRLAVSRGLASPLGDNGDGTDERSSSSESQTDEYDDDTVAELHADSSRSMARMQREVQRKLQEQIEVNDGSVDHHSQLVSADCQFVHGWLLIIDQAELGSSS